MSIAECLARLAPKTVQMDQLPGGGRPELTADEIAAALAGSGENQSLVVLAKYAGDEKALSLLHYAFAAEITKIAVKSNYVTDPELRGKAPLLNLARLVVTEIVYPRRCITCKGAGVNEAQQSCNPCHGSGFHQANSRERAIEIGVELHQWYRIFKPIYGEAINRLLCWESQALRNLAKKLS